MAANLGGLPRLSKVIHETGKGSTAELLCALNGTVVPVCVVPSRLVRMVALNMMVHAVTNQPDGSLARRR